MQSEGHQSQKQRILGFHSYEMSRTAKFTETEIRGSCLGLRWEYGGSREVKAKIYYISLWGDKSVLKLSGDSCTYLNIKNHWTVHFKWVNCINFLKSGFLPVFFLCVWLSSSRGMIQQAKRKTWKAKAFSLCTLHCAVPHSMSYCFRKSQVVVIVAGNSALIHSAPVL